MPFVVLFIFHVSRTSMMESKVKGGNIRGQVDMTMVIDLTNRHILITSLDLKIMYNFEFLFVIFK